MESPLCLNKTVTAFESTFSLKLSEGKDDESVDTLELGTSSSWDSRIRTLNSTLIMFGSKNSANDFLISSASNFLGSA